MVTDPDSSSRNFSACFGGHPFARPRSAFAQKKLGSALANQIRQATHARKSQLSIETQRGGIVPVAGNIEPSAGREGLRGDMLDERPAQALAAPFGPDSQQRDEPAQEDAVVDHRDAQRGPLR